MRFAMMNKQINLKYCVDLKTTKTSMFMLIEESSLPIILLNGCLDILTCIIDDYWRKITKFIVDVFVKKRHARVFS